ncbi:uncharacterized protein FOMMEDRAFT_161540 [Fomitiporia mediterranea MF3/22]|uniref:uncharacterized protein n=1 Tax=Fomitiporia mediterranea (strain MF3/22) TaxID=694068 RepID=UPI0004407FEB|nr:uncharacterized protein FOMMEDRAFT_161540 [Fomitiporia mediterranea MF3/22]EJC98710.1 hypothetical protein FOMMEDRAFT_161540 [Fomitiporia mediterranea MF3/22]
MLSGSWERSLMSVNCTTRALYLHEESSVRRLRVVLIYSEPFANVPPLNNTTDLSAQIWHCTKELTIDLVNSDVIDSIQSNCLLNFQKGSWWHCFISLWLCCFSPLKTGRIRGTLVKLGIPSTIFRFPISAEAYDSGQAEVSRHVPVVRCQPREEVLSMRFASYAGDAWFSSIEVILSACANDAFPRKVTPDSSANSPAKDSYTIPQIDAEDFSGSAGSGDYWHIPLTFGCRGYSEDPVVHVFLQRLFDYGRH